MNTSDLPTVMIYHMQLQLGRGRSPWQLCGARLGFEKRSIRQLPCLLQYLGQRVGAEVQVANLLSATLNLNSFVNVVGVVGAHQLLQLHSESRNQYRGPYTSSIIAA